MDSKENIWILEKMESKKIREKFLKFFEENGHKIVPSSSLIPDDPSVLLTTAGMQQFKPYYLGEKSPYGDRVATIQKCFRTSDIEEVGDESHLTFFEMFGNFSFNYCDTNIRIHTNDTNSGYFKKETIEWTYEFLTKDMGIARDRIWCSVFEGDKDTPFDQESYDILKRIGFTDKSIKKFGRKDNFWGPTGPEGPCGPNVEFYVDDLEVWNNVFNEYFRFKDGKLELLKNKGVDTGMGLERLAKIMQNAETVYETDLFSPIIQEIKNQKSKIKITNKNLKIEDEIRSIRIIADHMRGSVFLIGDGVLPSNIERGYILRRLLRRSIRYAKLLELSENWHTEIVKTIVENYKEYYPELRQKEDEIIKAIKEENEKFGKTLDKGLRELEKLDKVNAEKAFNVFQTYGFPLEMIREELSKRNLLIDEKDFQEEFKKHQEKSRAGLEKKFGGHGLIMDTGELKAGSEEEIKIATRLHTATHLLHQALRQVLGDNVRQMGSDINAERLRFDFMHDKKITPEELQKIENIVNEKIAENLEVKMEEMPYKKAMESGALAFFKGKYPEVVKVYSVGDLSTGSGQVFSKEVCGGPHASRTGELGKFKIKKEESSSAGVRRIRAVVE